MIEIKIFKIIEDISNEIVIKAQTLQVIMKIIEAMIIIEEVIIEMEVI
jgi:hypothetical protein